MREDWCIWPPHAVALTTYNNQSPEDSDSEPDYINQTEEDEEGSQDYINVGLEIKNQEDSLCDEDDYINMSQLPDCASSSNGSDDYENSAYL